LAQVVFYHYLCCMSNKFVGCFSTHSAGLNDLDSLFWGSALFSTDATGHPGSALDHAAFPARCASCLDAPRLFLKKISW
jgi:hypothetical protein